MIRIYDMASATPLDTGRQQETPLTALRQGPRDRLSPSLQLQEIPLVRHNPPQRFSALMSQPVDSFFD